MPDSREKWLNRNRRNDETATRTIINPATYIVAGLIIIFDGFGLNPNRLNNGWAQASTPYLDHYFASNPHTALQASGHAVGLPDGQFGNSEVGHLALGAGRVLEKELLRIMGVIHSGELRMNPAWKALLKDTRRVHLIGLVSDGGVHSHTEHLLGLLPLLKEAGVTPLIHMITDGRDTSPKSLRKISVRTGATTGRIGHR